MVQARQNILALALAMGIGLAGGVSWAAADGAAGKDKAAAAGTVNTVNTFNRLMKKTVEPNAPPPADGVHDPENPGTHALQPPGEAFSPLPRGMAGNKVDWVRALRQGVIAPRADREDPSAQKQVMDMDIIREVKGSMPDVVYPHLAHTEWLDCGQCHPKIFTPKKGSNAISMAAILGGQYCGVCHGKVAFPVSQCSKCHSKPKQAKPVSKAKAAPVAPVEKVAAAPPAEGAPAVLDREELMEKGRRVYADNCGGCHGMEGEGIPDTFPALKGSPVVRGSIEGHLDVVLNGVEGSAMPPWADQLSDTDIAAVVTYERNAWGNNTGDVVQPGAVKAAR